MTTTSFLTFAPDIYIKEYPIRYAGCHFFSRMTIVKLTNGKLWIHSPCEITQQLKTEIEKIPVSQMEELRSYCYEISKQYHTSKTIINRKKEMEREQG